MKALWHVPQNPGSADLSSIFFEVGFHQGGAIETNLKILPLNP